MSQHFRGLGGEDSPGSSEPSAALSDSSPVPGRYPIHRYPRASFPEISNGSMCTQDLAGHTAWADGQVDQSGMTTAWSPNTKVCGECRLTVVQLRPEPPPDLDLIGIKESDGGPTYAAVTSRSYHPGGVNALLADGSVRFVKESVAGTLWRALGRSQAERSSARTTSEHDPAQSSRSHRASRIAGAATTFTVRLPSALAPEAFGVVQ